MINSAADVEPLERNREQIKLGSKETIIDSIAYAQAA